MVRSLLFFALLTSAWANDHEVVSSSGAEANVFRVDQQDKAGEMSKLYKCFKSMKESDERLIENKIECGWDILSPKTLPSKYQRLYMAFVDHVEEFDIHADHYEMDMDNRRLLELHLHGDDYSIEIPAPDAKESRFDCGKDGADGEEKFPPKAPSKTIRDVAQAGEFVKSIADDIFPDQIEMFLKKWKFAASRRGVMEDHLNSVVCDCVTANVIDEPEKVAIITALEKPGAKFGFDDSDLKDLKAIAAKISDCNSYISWNER
jgi:hypothetical protein